MTVRATMIIDKINGTTVNVIPAIANPLPLDDFLALIPNISPVIDKINAR